MSLSESYLVEAAQELRNRRRAARSPARLHDVHLSRLVKWNWHHCLLGALLTTSHGRATNGLMIFVQPRSGKSELVSRRLPAFIPGRDPNATIIAASYGADSAGRMNRTTQRIIDSPEYRRCPRHAALGCKNCAAWPTALSAQLGPYSRWWAAGYYMGGRRWRFAHRHGRPVPAYRRPGQEPQRGQHATYRQTVEEWHTSTFTPALRPAATS